MLSGCAVYAGPPPASEWISGCTVFCDDFGCREICARYYYDADGRLIYWDDHFGCWIGPHGYWRGGVFYRGYVPGYHGWYNSGHYYAPHYAPHWHTPHWRRR